MVRHNKITKQQIIKNKAKIHNYWTNRDCFIFKPYFDGSIENYIGTIKHYKKLIFSDYDNLQACIDNINNLCPVINREKFHSRFHYRSIFNKPLEYSLYKLTDLEQLTFGESFNQPLSNSLDKLINLINITFGESFNQQLSSSLDQLINLTLITFGKSFNQPISKSFDKLINLEQLIFGNDFNQELSSSLDQLTNLKKLIFGKSFNQPLDNLLNKLKNLIELGIGVSFNQDLYLTLNIKILTLNCNNQTLVDSLPNSIEQLNLAYLFNLPLDNLPNSIKKLSFYPDSYYNNPLNNLPISLELLELPNKYKLEIKYFPPNCKIFMNNLLPL